MANIYKTYNLSSKNSFGIEAVADYFFDFETNRELVNFIRNDIAKYNPVRIIGSGCNILLSRQQIEGIIIQSQNRTIEKISEDTETVTLRVGAGYDWDTFVIYTLANLLYGLENLSGIPGSVGAAPVQNIGAYGAEAEQFIAVVETINLKTAETIILANKECQFGYRSSIFKSTDYIDFFITHVQFKLSKQPTLNTSYQALKTHVENITNPVPADVRSAVLKIRNSKLPDYKILGNAGSFFKNPVLNNTQAKRLINTFSNIQYWEQEDGYVKFSAAWLIDQCGFKGYSTDKGAGVYEYQPLILVNRGHATGCAIIELAQEIIETVNEKFGVVLDPEVNIW